MSLAMTTPDNPVSAKRLQFRYFLWMGAMPTLAFVVTFALLCAYECKAAPWFTVFAAPAVSVVVGVFAALNYWQKASTLPDREAGEARWLIVSSILWGPLLALLVFFAILFCLSLLSVGVQELFGERPYIGEKR